MDLRTELQAMADLMKARRPAPPPPVRQPAPARNAGEFYASSAYSKCSLCGSTDCVSHQCYGGVL